MAKIKEKPMVKDPKIMDKVSRIPREAVRRGMDESAGRVRQNVRDVQGHGDTPEDYASDKVEGAADDMTSQVGNAAENAGEIIRRHIKTRKACEQTDSGAWDADRVSDESTGEAAAHNGGSSHQINSRQTHAASRSGQEANAQGYQGGKQHAQRGAQVSRQTPAVQKETAKPARGSSVKTMRHSVKGTGTVAKTSGRSIKTAEHTARAVARTTKQTSQAVARKAKASAKAAAQGAKAAVKTAATGVKGIVAAMKALISAIAAGGWVAIVIILAVGIIAAILNSAFGIFYSNEAEDGTPMTDAIMEIDMGFRSEVDATIAELSDGAYDAINVVYKGDVDGDSAQVNNWNDVLSVYAAMLTMDMNIGTDVVTVTPEKMEKLKSIFNDMNKVSYTTDVETKEEVVENEVGEEETITTATLNIYITFTSLSFIEAADLYGFTEDQREVLDEMISPAYYSYFAALLGVDIYGGVDLTEIMSNLPVGTKGAKVVQAALTKLGAPYVWGAKGPNRFDCSGLVYWSVNEVDSELGSVMYTNAAGQAKWCYSHDRVVGRSELQPGDLVFWQNLGCDGCGRWNEVHHTGIYIGDGKVIEASSSKGRVVIRDLWESKNYPLFMFARL